MYHARFRGTHYDIGYKWGSMLLKHGNRILDFVPFEITGARIKFAQDCMPIYHKYYPEILDEIGGIAAGQQIEFDVLCAVLMSMYCFTFDNRCSCFAFEKDGKCIFARNSDFLVSLEKLYMNCIYKPDGAYAFNGNTTAFVEMEDGVNEYGLAAGLTFVYPKERKPGISAGLLIRYILEKCKTTKEALEAMGSMPISSTHTLTIADASGDIAVIEYSPAKEPVLIRPETTSRYVAATNTFHAKELSALNNPDIDDWRSDERYSNIQKALKENGSLFGADFAKDLLSDKYGFTCGYDRAGGGDTVWSVVYELTDKRIWRCEGNPKRKKFNEDERMKLL